MPEMPVHITDSFSSGNERPRVKTRVEMNLGLARIDSPEVCVEACLSFVRRIKGDRSFDQAYVAALLERLPDILREHFLSGDPGIRETTDGNGLLRGDSPSPYRVSECHNDGCRAYYIYEWEDAPKTECFCCILFQHSAVGQPYESRSCSIALGMNR